MQANDFLWPDAVNAIQAATTAAIDQARRTGTHLLVWENGKMISITPDEAEAQLHATQITATET